MGSWAARLSHRLDYRVVAVSDVGGAVHPTRTASTAALGGAIDEAAVARGVFRRDDSPRSGRRGIH